MSVELIMRQLIKALNFVHSRGWVPAENFDLIRGPSSALRQARDRMGVRGAFGTWQSSPTGSGERFVPLLYVAQASDLKKARLDVHRNVWTQGLVPLLIICTPSSIIFQEGFGYTNDESAWEKSHQSIANTDLDNSSSTTVKLLKRFTASRLLSSLAWKDYSVSPHSRVDRRLLTSLEALSKRLTSQCGAPAGTANALIGRFLYFFLLQEKGILSTGWLAQFEAERCFNERSDALTAELVWQVFDELDSVFNGTIFPLSANERLAFTNRDVRLLRDVIKLGDELYGEGTQISFLDFSLANLQTETLSAIYEKFLEIEDVDQKRKDGVFYTPPFLADFVLDRIEEETPLTPLTRIADCTAGSGVFIVGAFRRILENVIADRTESKLQAAELREILTHCVFAIEKNRSAQSVAAFSLYLTMLEYVQPDDIRACFERVASEPLFPKLHTQNIVCQDVFSPAPESWSDLRFDVVLGNPPWQEIALITDHHTKIEQLHGHRVDHGEAAEHTLWWTAKQFLKLGGIAALVMPTKSLISPSAKRFPQAVADELEVIGVVNLSYLRYQLFAHARHAACAMLLRNKAPTAGNIAWGYSPTRVHLPGSTQGDPWLITMDVSQLQRVSQRDLQNSEDGWFELLMLRPVDRYLRRYISDATRIGQNLTTIGQIPGLQLRKGGSPAQTGLKAEEIYGANKNKENDFRLVTGVELVQDIAQRSLFDLTQETNQTTLHCNPQFARRFGGDVLLIPRSMVNIAFAHSPIAFNSSINALYFEKGNEDQAGDDSKSGNGNEAELAQAQRRFLLATGLFLESSVANYLSALYGRLWILDRTRLEKNDLLDLPLPFLNVNDPMVESFISADDYHRTQLFCERAGLKGWGKRAVEEYIEFRHDFEDGGFPASWYRPAQQNEIDEYCNALSFVMRPVGGINGVHVQTLALADNPERRRLIITLDGQVYPSLVPSIDHIKDGVSDFSTSLPSIVEQEFVRSIKPAGKMHWTVDSAFADGAQLVRELLKA